MNKVKLLLSASVAVAAFGLVACGEDGSSGPDQESFIGESSDGGASEISSGDVAASSGSVKSSSSQIAANSSSQNGPDSSSQTLLSSSGAKSSGDTVEVNCYAVDNYQQVSAVRCDDGSYFASQESFGMSLGNLRKENPLFAKNCGAVMMTCVDGPTVVGGQMGSQRVGGCFPAVTCPQKVEYAGNCDELIERCLNSELPDNGGLNLDFSMTSECYEARNHCPAFSRSSSSQTATSSGDVESSSSQQNSGCGESAKWLETCFEQPVDDYGEMSNCAMNGESENCIPQYSCSSDKEGLYGAGCRDKGVYVCDGGVWKLTNCALPVLSSSSFAGGASSSSQAIVSSSGTEHYWWQEPCSVEGEQKSEDFGGVTDTYECVQGEWKIISKNFLNCDPDMDCVVDDWQNACKTNSIVGTACVVDEVDYGHKSIDGCDYFCYDGKWEYLPPPAE